MEKSTSRRHHMEGKSPLDRVELAGTIRIERVSTVWWEWLYA